MAASDPTGRPAATQRPPARRRLARRLGPWSLEAGVPFALVAYLGLRGGGYDEVVRGEIGIIVWWVLLLGAAVGALPRARLRRSAWIALALLAGLAVWTGAAMLWSESAERTATELARVAALLALFAFGLTTQGRPGLRRAVAGVAAGITVIGAVALLSRLEPNWFSQPETPDFIPESRDRLHYPLDYWNGLAALMAIGVPLLLALATSARHAVTRALWLAAVPVLGLVAFFTLSRGGAVAIAAGVAVLVALHPRRLALAARALGAAVAGAVLIAAADARTALTDGLTDADARAQGDELLAIALAVCILLALASVVAERALRGRRAPRIALRRRPALLGAGAVALAAVVAALAAGAPGALADAWEDFKDPAVPSAEAGRFESASGSGRYQFWSAAVAAGRSEPILGIGPGTYELFWAREGELAHFIRDAHSLYLEAFAELGAVGLLLVLAVVASPFAIGLARRRALGEERRAMLAGALGGCAAFALAAGIDWIWELTVAPAAFLLLAAAAIAAPERGPEAAPAPGRRAPRIALAALAVAGGVAVAIPTAGTMAIAESQERARAGDLDGALDAARTAGSLEPWAASPELQQALVLELQGEADEAAAQAREAVASEPTNWAYWLVLARLEADAGNPEAALAAFRYARALNPRSELFD